MDEKPFMEFNLLDKCLAEVEADRAGHADPATPHRLYGHVYASMKDEAASAIENALIRTKKPKAPDPDPAPISSPNAKIIEFPKRNLA